MLIQREKHISASSCVLAEIQSMISVVPVAEIVFNHWCEQWRTTASGHAQTQEQEISASDEESVMNPK